MSVRVSGHDEGVERKFPPLAATHRDLTVLCGIDGEQMKLDGEVYRCECGNEARADALEAFALGALAYVGATVIANPLS